MRLISFNIISNETVNVFVYWQFWIKILIVFSKFNCFKSLFGLLSFQIDHDERLLNMTVSFFSMMDDMKH